MPRTALGRGLSALIRDAETTGEGLLDLAVDRIDPSPFQPRTTFPEAKLQELANSIRSSGVVQPILVRKVADRYQLVAGERRWRAASLAGLTTVPAVVRQLSEQSALQLALTENLMREDLNPLDMAHGIESLVQRFALRHEEVAQQLGLDRSTITNTLRLLKLPEPVQDLLRQGRLTPGHARALLSVPHESLQLRLAKRASEEALSVRQVEALASPEANRVEDTPAPKRADPNVKAAVVELEQSLGARVQIKGSPSKGRIIIRYESNQDLDRIYNHLTRKADKLNPVLRPGQTAWGRSEGW
jgi:ParB family chromosome partitioning protein